MLTANCHACLRSGRGTLAQLEVYAVSRCDFTFHVSACQQVVVCPRCDRKLATPSAVGANDL